MSLTDEATANAVTAVWHDDEEKAEQWFSLISSTYHASLDANDGNPPGFDDFWSAFENAANSDHGANVDAFRGYLQNVDDPMTVVADLAGDEPDGVLAEVLSAYREGLAAAYAEQEADDEAAAEAVVAAEDEEPYDDAYWAAYLSRWASSWDGTETAWPEFVEGFGYWATEEPKFAGQLKEQADALLAHAGTLELGARVAYLADFGLVALVETPAPPEASPELITELAGTEAVTGAVAELLDKEVVAALTAALNEFPEAADLTPEEINEVLEQVLTEQLAQIAD